MPLINFALVSKERPIGVFDSGIGGLTVAKAIRRALPNESIVYFGDTAHVPYGDKSPELIRRYSKGITQFLLDKHCKAIVIACNTASAHAYAVVREMVPDHIPVVNVIDPVVEEVASKYAKGKIGIIGTKGTVRSRVYVNRIKKANPKLEVVSQSTPLLAPMIEEGFYDNNISKTIISAYLNTSRLKKLDALVLGCTHYPLIKREVTSFCPESTEVLDSSELTATHLKGILKKMKMLNPSQTHQPDHFYISDYTASFNKNASRFFKAEVKVEEVRLWDKK